MKVLLTGYLIVVVALAAYLVGDLPPRKASFAQHFLSGCWCGVVALLWPVLALLIAGAVTFDRITTTRLTHGGSDE